jgi:hypothetical protein
VVFAIDETVTGKELVPVQGDQGMLQFHHALLGVILPFAADRAILHKAPSRQLTMDN